MCLRIVPHIELSHSHEMSYFPGQLVDDIAGTIGDAAYGNGNGNCYGYGAATPRELILQDLEQVDEDLNQVRLARATARAQRAAAMRSGRRAPAVEVYETGDYDEPIDLSEQFYRERASRQMPRRGGYDTELKRDFAAAKAAAQKKVLRRNQWINTLTSAAVTGGLWSLSPVAGLAGAAATPVIMERFLPTRPNESWPLTLGQAALGATGATIGAALVPGAAPVGAAIGELVGAGFGSNLGDTRLGQSHTKTDFGVRDKDVIVGAVKGHKRRVGAINKQWKEIQQAKAKLARMERKLIQRADNAGLQFVQH